MKRFKVSCLVKKAFSTGFAFSLPFEAWPKSDFFKMMEKKIEETKKFNEEMKESGHPELMEEEEELPQNVISTPIGKLRSFSEASVEDRLDTFKPYKEQLQKILPDFEKPETIKKKILELYQKGTDESQMAAGEYAQNYLSFNPLKMWLNYAPKFFGEEYFSLFGLEEQMEEISLFSSDQITIVGVPDLFEDSFLYEFKLTSEKNLEIRLKQALAQIYLYDFLIKAKYGIRCVIPKIIEIYLIDKQKILRYWFYDTDKEVIKKLFELNEIDQYLKIALGEPAQNADPGLWRSLVDSMYEDLLPVLEEERVLFDFITLMHRWQLFKLRHKPQANSAREKQIRDKLLNFFETIHKKDLDEVYGPEDWKSGIVNNYGEKWKDSIIQTFGDDWINA